MKKEFKLRTPFFKYLKPSYFYTKSWTFPIRRLSQYIYVLELGPLVIIKREPYTDIEKKIKVGWNDLIKKIILDDRLPVGLNWYDLVDVDGNTVAHCVAEMIVHNRTKLVIPDEYVKLRNRNGWTVAHNLAYGGKLPKKFHDWEMADFAGVSVAHAYAGGGHAFPKDSPLLLLVDNAGLSVHDFFMTYEEEKIKQKKKEREDGLHKTGQEG